MNRSDWFLNISLYNQLVPGYTGLLTWIIISEGVVHFRVGMRRVLPCLRQHPIVPVDVVPARGERIEITCPEMHVDQA
jgi:hypothetical protein